MRESSVATNHLDQIVTAYRAGKPLVFLFDYDGTLTPIVPHPDLAILPSNTRDLLAALTQLPSVAVAVVSGRALEVVRKLVAVTGVYYAGCGGMELDLLGTCLMDPVGQRAGELLDLVHDRLQELLRMYPGTWIERKPVTMAIHYRDLQPLARVCFNSEVAEILGSIAELRYRDVSSAIEVGPIDGWDKGTAVDAILGQVRVMSGRTPFPIYFGDAPNDEEGMLATLRAGGIAVGVGPDSPAIECVRLPDPNAVFVCLTQLYPQLAFGHNSSSPFTT